MLWSFKPEFVQPVFDFISNYANISGAEMKAMLNRIHFSSFKKNEAIFQQDSKAQKIVFILKGSVRWCYSDENGDEHTVNFTFENQPVVPFGSFEHQLPCANSVITIESTYAAWTSHEEFFGFMKEFPNYEIPARPLLGEFLKVEIEQAKLLRISSAKERYEALLKLRPEVIKRVPQIYIASYLGISPETLSRVRAGKF